MKRLKKMYKENRVFTILMGICLLCMLILIILVSYYLISSTSKSKYGNRLDGINDVEINNSQKSELENKVIEDADVETAEVEVHGKIVYFDIKVNDDVSVAKGKEIANKTIKYFDDDYLNYYDLHYMIYKSNKDNKNYPILGYKKAGAKAISYSYNAKE